MSETLKPEGIRSLLLGPIALLSEFMGALVPGVLFCLLLLVKRVPIAISAVDSGVFGYRTKVACGLLVAYVIGKLFYIPVTLFQNRLYKVNDNLKLYDPSLRGHPKPANEGHLKTGQREWGRGR